MIDQRLADVSQRASWRGSGAGVPCFTAQLLYEHLYTVAKSGMSSEDTFQVHELE